MSNVVKLKVDSSEYESKIQRAAQGIQHLGLSLRDSGKTFADADKEAIAFVRQLGQMETKSQTARGKIGEMSTAFINLKQQYQQMTAAEKQSPVGQALAKSLDQLKQRTISAKTELAGINKELEGTSAFNSALGQLGSKLGINSELMGMLTTGTIAYTAAIGAAATAVAYAAKEWAAYNSELSKQQQITGVTTGLKGADADNMTAAARAISRVYGTDFREVINAANTLMTQFGETGNEAIRLLKDGMQGMINGDGGKLLQMIQQYAPAFRDAGVSASQLIAVIQNSEGGIFTSENMNAIVMGIKNIRLMTNATSEALGKLGIDGQKMSKDLSDGTITIFDALKKVAESIDNVGSGSQAAGEVMQTVFGRQGAMAGTKLGEAIASLNLNLDETKGQTGELGESLQRLTDETEKFEKKLMDIAGFDGWDTMTNDIKTGVLISLNETLDSLKAILHQLNGIAGIDLNATNMAKWFTDIITYCYELINPLAGVVHLLGFIGKGTGGGSTGSGNQLSPEMQRVYNLADHGTPENSVGDVVVTYTRPTTTTKTPRGGRGGRSGKVDKVFPEGSIGALNQEMKKLQEQQHLVTEPKEWKRLQDAIDGVTKRINVIKGIEEAIDFDNMFTMQQITTVSKSIGESLVDGIIGDIAGSIQDADTNTLSNLLRVVIKNGIEGIDIPADAIMEQIFGDGADIPNSYWQELESKINEKLKELGIDPIKINFETGEINTSSDKKNRKTRQQMAEEYGQNATVVGATSDITNGVNGILSGIEQMGIEIPQELKGIMSGIQGVMTILTSINTILGVIEGLQTVGVLPFFARGGIVPHAASGYEVPGTHYSGDVTPIMANAGEVVLTRAQAGSLAADIQNGGGRSVQVHGVLRGEDIILSANRTFKRKGQGEIVTW